MFFEPQAVAVIGASRTPGKLGHVVLSNILQGGYQGAVYPINPQADEILGVPCYPSVLAVPGTVDLAVILIPSPQVAAALVECGEKRVRGAVIISAGFREMGGEGWQREREIVEIARRYGMRLIGPNSLGIIEPVSRLNASFASAMPRLGTIAFMSQSGALCTSILDMALADRIGFSHFVSLGNKADTDENTFIEAWHRDPHTRVIIAYLEGIENGPEFMRIAAQVSREKPIIVIKSGTTHAGSRAVSSHTGTLAGSEQAYEAAFHQSGVLRVRSLQELFDYAVAFARQPLISNPWVAVVTNAGGPGIMAADACERAGLQLAHLGTETMERLSRALPASASVLNPVDVLGDAPAERYRVALEEVSADPNVGSLLVILTPQATTQVEKTAQIIGELSLKNEKPLIACFMGQNAVEPGIQLLHQYNVPNYPVPERAVAALAAMMHHRRWRERLPAEPETLVADRIRVFRVLAQAQAEGRLILGDLEAQEILKAYGVPVPCTGMAHTADQAVCLAEQIGFPVVLKIVSPDISYKREVGGICLDVQTTTQVRVAFAQLTYRILQTMPEAEILGCLVQETVLAGKEVVIGMVRDPHFGPLMRLGVGGIYSEFLRDVAYRVAPFDRREAREMIRDSGVYPLLQGRYDEPISDLDALTEILLRLGQLASDFPEIVEFEISPLIVLEKGRGAVAVDIRFVLK
ncbi:MAG: acetate--CoA ligase alpha subunit [Anaerolineae bacterium]